MVYYLNMTNTTKQKTEPEQISKTLSEGVQDEKSLAIIAHIGGIFFGIIAPLIIWILQKDKPNASFSTHHAKEALNFQISVLLASAVAGLTTIVLIGFLFLPAVMVANVIFCILAAIEANKGLPYNYPFSLRLVK